MALEWVALGVEQTAEYGYGLHHIDGAIVHATLVQVVAAASGLNGGSRDVSPFKVETHRAVFIRCERDKVAPWAQYCAAAAQVIGAQGNTVNIGLHIYNHTRAATTVFTGHHRFTATDCDSAVQVQASGEFAVIRGALHKTVAIERVGLDTCATGQTDTVSVGGCRGRDALQQVMFQGFVIGQRAVVIASTVAGAA